MKSKHLRAFEKSKLAPDEKVLATLDGYIGKLMGSGEDTQHNGIFIITNKRVSFYRKGLFSEIYKGIQISNIYSLEQKVVLGHQTLAIYTSGEDIVFKSMEKKKLFVRAFDVIEDLRAQLNIKPVQTITQSTTPSDSPLAKIEKLGELKEKGFITEDEFQEQKRRLLDSL